MESRKVLVKCTICYDIYSTDDMRSLRCGHCYCEECMDKAAKKSCPACRESKSSRSKLATSRFGRPSKDSNDSPDSDVRRIYLEPPDVANECTYNVNPPGNAFLKNMRRAAVQIDDILESELDVTSVQRTMDTLDTAKKYSQDVSEKAQDIVMHAINELDKRIKDVLPELQRLREENIALIAAAKEREEKLATAQEELKLLERTRNEVSRLRNERDHWHTQYNKANAERRKFYESANKATKEVEEAKRLLSSKDGDIVELKKELDNLKKKAMLRHQKMKAVQRENQQLRKNQIPVNADLSAEELIINEINDNPHRLVRLSSPTPPRSDSRPNSWHTSKSQSAQKLQVAADIEISDPVVSNETRVRSIQRVSKKRKVLPESDHA